MSNTIAEYFATLKLVPDVSSIRKVDQFFRVLENRLNKASKRISPAMGALGLGGQVNSGGAVRSIREISTAQTRATGRVISAQMRLNDLLRIERSIRESILRLSSRTPRTPATSRTATTVNRPARASGGGSSGFGMRDVYHGVVGASIAGYGLGQLSDVSQKLEMLPVSMEAVTGSAAKAAQQLEFLAKLGHEMGATRLELAPEYTKMLASGMGTKLEAQMPTIFTSMVRYGKVMGLEPEEMKGSFKAVSQMINKQQIMAEELKGQLAERLPAAVRIMADAVTGGDTKKLFALMKGGGLDPNTALPKFAMELEKRAAGGMEAYKKTQRGQQNFARVALEDQAINFGKSGGNAAWLKIWKAFADTLPKLNGLVKTLAGAFSGLARVVEGLGTMLQVVSSSFDWFYALPDQVQYLGKVAGAVFAGIAIRAGALGAVLARAFLPLTAVYIILEDLARGFMGKNSYTKEVLDYFSGNSSKSNSTGNFGSVGTSAKVGDKYSATFLSANSQNSKAWAELDSSPPIATAGTAMVSAANAQNAKAWGGQNIAISVDVTGDTTDNQKVAQMVGDILKPMIFNKVPVE